ncbi:methyltransferase domain-containing protein [Stappia taiwanensis]|uniref:Methyltransferase domain-containing protein n=1 Tax=Stappia taiwanensis TaxID=992267 RepID=A0A838XQP5_9HYPH|nr:methyltransferase domain-containing protein [Stappia taiwanensis]MBA4611361.1 methyltransferase domain-containing protein [Stappia taiwanensis]GGF00893.1 methyltransferase [Stappia taiwanensis]
MSQPELFDRPLLAQRRRQALTRAVAGADFLLQAAATDLAERLQTVNKSFEVGIDLGGHTGRMTTLMRASGKVERVIRADLFLADPAVPGCDLVIDDALPPFADASVDLIVSPLALHFVNDLPGTLIQIRRALRPDGLFLGALLGGDTLRELGDVLMRAELEVKGGAAPRVAPFADTRSLGALLQRAGFALPVADFDRVTVRYDTLFDLMRDLKAMGATSVLRDRSRTPLPRRVFLRAAELYQELHADPDGRLRATFDIVSLSGWAPHESQQKPLKPGSARQRLADALGTTERPAHDPARPGRK